MNAPSIQRLQADLGLTTQQAKLVRALIRKEVKTWDETLFPATSAWLKTCYHRPSYPDRLLSALNEVIGGHGVETIEGREFNQPSALYVNTGDAYSPTLLYCYKSNTVRLTTWGDYAERL